ncbi:hypothetical protein BDW62DRAFT_66169 [Aspergillus aurantiobrunneus]
MSHSPTAARSLSTSTTLFAGPGSASNSTPSVNGSALFRLVLDGDVQTLSAENAPKNGPIKGLLFVPSLSRNDPCVNTTAPFIPANVTRHHDVTAFGYQIIGLAPWITPNCSQSFLDASSRIGTEALLFFLPASDNTKPPPPADPTWRLNGETSWENKNLYPVYAVPGSAGITLMEQLSWYSGNVTQPQSQQNVSAQGEGWDVRLFTLIDLEGTSRKKSSIWGFLLAILGTILVLSIILLLLYQLLQRRRREILQRRLEADRAAHQQFDLQHFKVPREFLVRFPIYVYPSLDDVGRDYSQQNPHDTHRSDRAESVKSVGTEQTKNGKESEAEEEEGAHMTKYNSSIRVEDASVAEQKPKTTPAETEDTSPRPAPYVTFTPTTVDSGVLYQKNANRLSHSQTRCVICLDDFVPALSTVRELPCGHIYHPECIDVSLTQTSSLCPLCKKCVFMSEFCPISAPEAVYQQENMGEP